MTRRTEISFKSTLDWIINDLAVKLSAALPPNNPVRAFDLDDAASERQIQAGAEHALVYQYTHLAEDPTHPLYEAQFLVGAKTTDDSGNYDMTTLLTDLRGIFPQGASFDLYDYSEVEEGEDPGPALGCLVIMSLGTGPQMFEKQSGIRLLAVSGKVMAYGDD